MAFLMGVQTAATTSALFSYDNSAYNAHLFGADAVLGAYFTGDATHASAGAQALGARTKSGEGVLLGFSSTQMDCELVFSKPKPVPDTAQEIYWRTAEPFAAIPGGPAWNGNAYASVVAPAGTDTCDNGAVFATAEDDSGYATDGNYEPKNARTTGRRTTRTTRTTRARSTRAQLATAPSAFKKVVHRHKFTAAACNAILRAVAENRCKATASKKNPYGISWTEIERRVLEDGDYPELLCHWATPGSKNVSRYFYKNLLDAPYFNAARVWK